MSRLARELQGEHGDVEATLQAITAAAVLTVPGVDECGISYVIGRARIEPRAATGHLPHHVDLLQQELRQGPCLDAVWDQEIVRVDDLTSDQRWPELSRRARDIGVGGMMCFQLFVIGDQLGALNLYARAPRAFGDEAEDIGQVFASHAAVALAGAQHEEHLRAGMRSRDLIGQAKGILMERHKLTADQSFALLTRISQELNRKLVDIARELAETGDIPAGAGRRD
ncbi:GAF and ANTAR domain-containing protein [Blastococcus sp. TF02A-30]|uniref:GAF and ANTAR domain-containing protein n=1 Tax=Blastococcus sp. TF02A-30 TaxID=2250580 RepID=UPI001F37EF36|nr:GAF and ANTAR domain-containing protein [Blastococcus sp. TF02A-30]